MCIYHHLIYQLSAERFEERVLHIWEEYQSRHRFREPFWTELTRDFGVNYPDVVSCFNVFVHCCLLLGPCSSSPCQNGGECYHENDQFACRCASGYIGTFCEEHGKLGLLFTQHETCNCQTKTLVYLLIAGPSLKQTYSLTIHWTWT